MRCGHTWAPQWRPLGILCTARGTLNMHLNLTNTLLFLFCSSNPSWESHPQPHTPQQHNASATGVGTYDEREQLVPRTREPPLTTLFLTVPARAGHQSLHVWVANFVLQVIRPVHTQPSQANSGRMRPARAEFTWVMESISSPPWMSIVTCRELSAPPAPCRA